jgi:molybdate transport system ATP-binding protein
MLEVDLRARRGDFELEVQAVLPSGAAAVFGPSGAGKSTLLHVLAGLIRPRHGRIRLDDRVLFDSAAGVHVPAHRRGIGVVFQDGLLFPHRSVLSNLTFATRGARKPGLDRAIELLGLGPLLRRRPAELSGGEARRVALGRALAAEPRLLLLDEPLSGLDGGLKRQIVPLLRRVRDELKTPILLVSHELRDVLQLTDRLLVLEVGRSVATGSYLDLAHQTAVQPIIHRSGLVNILEVGGGPLARLAAQAPAGVSARTAALRPEDIALATARVSGTSIQNQLEATVTRVSEHGGRVLVEVVAGQPLLVEITPAAAGALAIGPGARVWCLIKSSALEWLA